jgi:hypothetical protein
MMKTKVLTLLVAAGFLGGCNMNNLSDGQTGALVGAGLIGGAVGYLGGTAIGNSK